MSRIGVDRRVFLSAGLADFACHGFLGALFFRADEVFRAAGYGHAPDKLGFLSFCGDATYMAVALGAARASDRFGRRAAIRFAGLVMCAAAAFAWRAADIWSLGAALIALRAATAVFWPSAQARVADQAVDLGRAVAVFNLSWCIGKSAGYLTDAVLRGPLGRPISDAFLGSCAAALMIALAIPRDRRGADGGGARGPGATDAERASAAAKIGAAWLGNIANCTAFSVLLTQGAPLLGARGFAPADAESAGNLILATLVFCQMCAFLWMGGRTRLIGRTSWLLAPTALIVAGLGAFELSGALWSALASAAIIGVGCGTSYSQSLVLSLRLPRPATAGAARHEAVIGLGNALAAPLGGLAAVMLGRADAAVWCAIALVLVVLVAQAAKLAGADRLAPA